MAMLSSNSARWMSVVEFGFLFLLLYAVAGDPPPAINEAHYLIKAKHFWDPSFLDQDLFVTSRGAHTFFFFVTGWLTQFFDLSTTAWLARFAGWTTLAIGLQRFGKACLPLFLRSGRTTARLAIVPVTAAWIVGVSRCNLAGEWIVGGIEAKVFAYGFLLLGAANLAQGRWNRVWVYFGIAAAFHVLVGGWAVVGAMIVRFVELRSSQRFWPNRNEALALLAGGAISLFGLVPALQLSAGSSSADQILAMENYVYGRLAHHLAPASFPIDWYLRHGLLLGFTVLAGRAISKQITSIHKASFNRIMGFLATGPAIACLGLAIGVIPAWSPELGAKLLRFYWFRMTDAYVPLAAGTICVGWMLQHNDSLTRTWRWLALSILVLSGVTLAYDTAVRLRNNIPTAVFAAHDVEIAGEIANDLSTRRRIYEEWEAVCQFIKSQTPEDAIFITPRAQHTFKWYAQRAEVVNWKDVPQDVVSGIEWAHRFNAVFPRELKRRHPPTDPRSLTRLQAEYGASHLLIDRRVTLAPQHLVQIYPNADSPGKTYAVYLLSN